jgi:hypothetical protein
MTDAEPAGEEDISTALATAAAASRSKAGGQALPAAARATASTVTVTLTSREGEAGERLLASSNHETLDHEPMARGQRPSPISDEPGLAIDDLVEVAGMSHARLDVE